MHPYGNWFTKTLFIIAMIIFWPVALVVLICLLMYAVASG